MTGSEARYHRVVIWTVDWLPGRWSTVVLYRSRHPAHVRYVPDSPNGQTLLRTDCVLYGQSIQSKPKGLAIVLHGYYRSKSACGRASHAYVSLIWRSNKSCSTVMR